MLGPLGLEMADWVRSEFDLNESPSRVDEADVQEAARIVEGINLWTAGADRPMLREMVEALITQFPGDEDEDEEDEDEEDEE